MVETSRGLVPVCACRSLNRFRVLDLRPLVMASWACRSRRLAGVWENAMLLSGVLAVQNPRISKSPHLSSPVAASLSILWLVNLVGEVFTFSLAQPWMRGFVARCRGGEGSAGQIY